MSANDPKRPLGEPSKPTLKSVRSDIRGTSTMMVCDMGASLYEPINIYKPVAPNIGIVDEAAKTLARFPAFQKVVSTA
jgi:hypothetical protein